MSSSNCLPMPWILEKTGTTLAVQSWCLCHFLLRWKDGLQSVPEIFQGVIQVLHSFYLDKRVDCTTGFAQLLSWQKSWLYQLWKSNKSCKRTTWFANRQSCKQYYPQFLISKVFSDTGLTWMISFAGEDTRMVMARTVVGTRLWLR